MPYEKEEDERSEINWDRKAVRGCNYKVPLTHVNNNKWCCTPSPPAVVPSPYKQGESALRIALA